MAGRRVKGSGGFIGFFSGWVLVLEAHTGMGKVLGKAHWTWTMDHGDSKEV